MYSGNVDEWYARLDSLKALPHKHKLYVPGNHDFHVQNYEGVAVAELKAAGVKVVGLRTPVITLEGIKILGLPWVTKLRGWAFNVAEEWLADYLATLNPSPDIVISHAPMRGTLDALNPEQWKKRDQGHIGCKAYRDWFTKLEVKPKYWICGHIHESYGHSSLDGCTFLNVAMCDRDYKQTNTPMVINL